MLSWDLASCDTIGQAFEEACEDLEVVAHCTASFAFSEKSTVAPSHQKHNGVIYARCPTVRGLLCSEVFRVETGELII